MRVAFRCRTAAQHDAHNVSAVAMNRRDQIEPRRAGEAGFDAVDTLDRSEQMVVIADSDAVLHEGRQRKVSVISGKTILDCAAEQRLVACRGDLIVVRQA